jgi:hypothetical protein
MTFTVSAPLLRRLKMKTIIEFEDGKIEERDDVVPSIDIEENHTVCLVSSDYEIISDDIPLDLIKRIIFIP